MQSRVLQARLQKAYLNQLCDSGSPFYSAFVTQMWALNDTVFPHWPARLVNETSLWAFIRCGHRISSLTRLVIETKPIGLYSLKVLSCKWDELLIDRATTRGNVVCVTCVHYQSWYDDCTGFRKRGRREVFILQWNHNHRFWRCLQVTWTHGMYGALNGGGGFKPLQLILIAWMWVQCIS